MTEEQAKTKWCPMVRTRDAGFQGYGSAIISSAVNREARDKDKVIADVTRCIASDCMMWRLSDYGKARDVADGFCGLAGNPAAIAS